MYTQELFVHDRRQRQRAERLNAGLVDTLAVFMLAFQLEGKVVREMSAFMVASEQPKRVRVPDLQGPEI